MRTEPATGVALGDRFLSVEMVRCGDHTALEVVEWEMTDTSPRGRRVTLTPTSHALDPRRVDVTWIGEVAYFRTADEAITYEQERTMRSAVVPWGPPSWRMGMREAVQRIIEAEALRDPWKATTSPA